MVSASNRGLLCTSGLKRLNDFHRIENNCALQLFAFCGVCEGGLTRAVVIGVSCEVKGGCKRLLESPKNT